MTLPTWAPADETKPAPMPLLLVQAFVNSGEIDGDTDLLREPETALAWFVEAGLLEEGDKVDARDLQVARQVREGIRRLLVANAGGPPPTVGALEPLVALTEAYKPRISVAANGDVGLERATGPGLPAALTTFLLVIRDAQRDRSWQKLKACENDECCWAYYDRSHSQRGRWCDMAGCGNRIKNRTLRSRQRLARPVADKA